MASMSKMVQSSESELSKTVQKMLLDQRNNLVSQAELDKYLLPVWFESTAGVDALPIDLTAMPLKSVLQVHHMPDIGIHVRNIVMRQKPVDTLGKLIQFSMPYIKHNRLSFPAYTEDVRTWTPAAIQITLGMLLGLFSEKLRKPTWSNRVRIVGTFYTLLVHGTYADLYLFCVENLSLLRLAVIEYYCTFVSKNLPAEMEVQSLQFGGYSGNTMRQIILIVNQFRQDNLQDDAIDWAQLNCKAQQSIEKCNRCCKNKYKLAKNVVATVQHARESILQSLCP